MLVDYLKEIPANIQEALALVYYKICENRSETVSKL